MSQSAKLSQRHLRDVGGRIINNECAKAHDVKVRDVMQKVLSKIQEQFPGKRFELKNVILQKNLEI